MKYYQEFTLNVLGTIDSLGSLMSTFVMDEVKHDYGIPIGNRNAAASSGSVYFRSANSARREPKRKTNLLSLSRSER